MTKKCKWTKVIPSSFNFLKAFWITEKENGLTGEIEKINHPEGYNYKLWVGGKYNGDFKTLAQAKNWFDLLP